MFKLRTTTRLVVSGDIPPPPNQQQKTFVIHVTIFVSLEVNMLWGSVFTVHSLLHEISN